MEAYLEDNRPTIDEVCESYDECNKECPLYKFCYPQKARVKKMNFELGKEYIVKVSEEGIIPVEKFESDRFYDKDHDDLDFLTDEEKAIVINDVLDKIKGYVEHIRNTGMGKKKSLEFIEKFIEGLKTENEE